MQNYVNKMQSCIQLAKQAQGLTSPNPMVGCIVIDQQGEIVSTGYHKKYGEFHAERDALSKLNNAKDCTLIVNLEPCCHHGKTPPCTDIIIEKGIKRVVYGMQDPNPIVTGKGLKILKQAGIEVIGPVLEEECKKLNEIFIKNKTQNKTFVVIKTATTIDGKIATRTKDSKWITSKNARNKGRELRQHYDAILTSSSTVIADNPEMIHSTKIILDRNLKTDFANAKIYQQGKILVFYDKTITKPNVNNKNIQFIPADTINEKLDIKEILGKIYKLGIMSIFVESGGTLNASFLPYADKIYHFMAPKILGDNNGKSCFDGTFVEKISQCAKFKIESAEILSPDIILTYIKY